MKERQGVVVVEWTVAGVGVEPSCYYTSLYLPAGCALGKASRSLLTPPP